MPPKFELAVQRGYEDLAAQFQEWAAAIEAALAADSSEETERIAQEAKDLVRVEMNDLRNGSSLQVRDDMAAFIAAEEARAQMIRAAVIRAEKMARHHEARASYMKASILGAMLDWGVRQINGLASGFTVSKRPDKLVVTRETDIPAEYFEEVITTTRVLNKEKLTLDLAVGKQIPGAFLETDRTSLLIR